MGVPLTTREAYDPATNTWATKTSIPLARDHPTGAVVNGLFHIQGGYYNNPLGTMDAYDPGTNAWTTKPAAPSGRYRATANVVNGILYVAGGFVPGTPLATLEAYRQ